MGHCFVPLGVGFVVGPDGLFGLGAELGSVGAAEGLLPQGRGGEALDPGLGGQED